MLGCVPFLRVYLSVFSSCEPCAYVRSPKQNSIILTIILQSYKFCLTLETQSIYHKDVRIPQFKSMAILATNKPIMPNNRNGLWHVLHPLFRHWRSFGNGGMLACFPILGPSGLFRLLLNLIHLRR